MNGTRKTPLLEPGITLNGKWEILEHLATGGKGEVYRAHQISLERDVVVKTISLEFLAEFSDPEEIETETQRFHREATAMAQVKHPHVAQVYDHDSATITRNGAEVTVQYLVMEYISGLTLRGTMTAEGFGDNEDDLINWLRLYFLPILDGIAAVHELGIVHRDIKPENVLLDGAVPKITDFGIAGGIHWKPLTSSYHVEGTIQYMAPEQFTDFGETDSRGDVYALGKILYEAIVGKMRRETACPLRGVCLQSPQTDLLKQFDLVIQKATAEDVTQRTTSVKEFKEAIEVSLPSPRNDLLNKLDVLVEKASIEDKAERFAAVKEAKEAVEAIVTDSGEFDVLARGPAPGWGGRRRKVIIALAVLLVIEGFVGFYLYHHFDMVEQHPIPAQSVVADNGPKPSPERPEGAPPAVTVAGHIPVTIKGPDGDCILRLIPEGEVTLSESFGAKAGQVVKVSPFYIMETPVTNADFVEFLNQILPELQVEQETVRRGASILLMLGEVVKGYEPIIFRDGKFSLKDEVFALRPVLRVTGYGASAYAQFYGERLPTELEWLRLMQIPDLQTTPPAEPARPRTARENQSWMDGWMEWERQQAVVPPGTGSKVTGQRIESNIPSPVSLFQPDSYGIRGLGKSIGEWGLRISEDPSTRKTEEKYIILGGVKGSTEHKSNELPVIARNPWEAFEEVGFRCVLNIKPR